MILAWAESSRDFYLVTKVEVASDIGGTLLQVPEAVIMDHAGGSVVYLGRQ